MAGSMMNNVMGHVKDMSSRTLDEMKRMQSSPIGTEKRTPRERSAMWKSMMDLPQETRDAIMNEMAALAGHKGDKLDGCDFCKLVKEQARK